MRRRFGVSKTDVCAGAKSLMLSGWARPVWGDCRAEILLGQECSST